MVTLPTSALFMFRLLQLARIGAILFMAHAPAAGHAQSPDISSSAFESRPLDSSTAVPQIPPWRDVPWTETVDPNRRLSLALSEGSTSSGQLLNAVHLPAQGQYHYILGEHEGRDTHWGGGILVEAIQDASEWAERRFPGMRVGIGNLSVRSGGPLRWSRSHHSGRDADIAFRYLDETGQPVEAQGLYVVRSDLTVREPAGWSVDVPRTWAIVEGLIVTHGGAIQWIFVSQPLKDALLEHAVSIGVSPSVVAMASVVLHQPGDSRPHDDHLHLRVYCTANEAAEQCVDRPPFWDHAELHSQLLQARVREFAHGILENPDAAELILERIRNSGLIRQLPELFHFLPDFSSLAQQQVIELTVLQNDRTWIARLADVAPLMRNEAEQRLVIGAMRRLAHNEDAELFIPLFDFRTDAGVSVASLAAEALQRLRHPAVVVTLASLSTSLNPVEAQHAALALCRMTANGGPDGLCEMSPLLGSVEWHDFWLQQVDLLGELPDDDEIVERFQDAGLVTGDIRNDASTWVALLSHPSDWVRFSAERMLCRHFGESLSPPEADTEERQEWWSRRIRRSR